jgi:hypothetical protein
MKILTGLHDLPGNEPTIQTAELVARLAGAELTLRQEMRAGRLLVEAAKGAYDLIVVRWTGKSWCAVGAARSPSRWSRPGSGWRG